MRLLLPYHGGHVNESLNLDRPVSNFDVAGVPTGAWSSSILGCFNNIFPSCLFSFCCPCIMWSQVVVRAQIPLLISMKNSFACARNNSGYRCFIDVFSWTLLVGATAILLLIILYNQLPYQVLLLMGIVAFAFLVPLYVIIGHVRTAFKEKYRIRELPEGCEAWECCGDTIVSCVCFPCSLAQMARHVFQYDRWDPEIGIFAGDPYTLPPLEDDFRRPVEADNAGMVWTDSRPHPNGERGLGRNNRPVPPRAPNDPNNPTNVPVSRGMVPRPTPQEQRTPLAVVVDAYPESVVYNADGTIVQPN